MASTVITAPELHEESDDVIRSMLLEYVPTFRQHMDRGAGDLIGDLESIMEHQLWARVGFESMEAYANEHLSHSEEWCREVIRIYRHDWSPEQRQKRSIGDLVASVPAAKAHGGTGANQYSKDESKVANSHSAKLSSKSSNSPERIIARLKRDAETDPQAQALLGSIEAGDIKPYRAAVQMGWVKPPDPAAIVEKQREKLEPEQQVQIWEQWGRALPDGVVDREGIARTAISNLNHTERDRVLRWARAAFRRR